jgi:tripartite-type tricarboxylate transporter receptor subunit TctC
VGLYFPNLASALPNIRSGRLKALAVTGAKRTQAAPDIPALAETLAGYEAASWYGIVVPTRTPKTVISRLNADIGKALQMTDVQQRFLALGGDVVGGSPEELGRTMRAGSQKWSKLVHEIELRSR